MLFFIISILLLLLSFSTILFLSIKRFSFSFRSLVALLLGIIIGLFLYYVQKNNLISNSLDFYNLEIYRVISSIYINFLRAMIYPLLVVAILTALTKIDNIRELGTYGLSILAILLISVAIGSIVAIGVMYFSGITNNFVLPTSNIDTAISYQDKVTGNMSDMIINFFPTNPFLDLTGARRTSTIATVIFISIIGIAYIIAKKEHPQETSFFKKIVDSCYVIIMKALSIILRLTPYGIIALVAKVIATTNVSSMLHLANFVICTLVAIFIVFILQTIAVLLFGFNPLTYYKKVFPLLSFAFFSRSSAASIPIGVKIQTNQLGINQTIANLSTTLGATIGQVGCVGIYVTMVIFITASASGVNPWNISFILFTIFIVIITSFGVGGIGGGAIYGALVGLAAFSYPLSVLGFLIPVEAVIDMFRTLANVNGLTISGLITSRLTKTINKTTFNSNKAVEID